MSEKEKQKNILSSESTEAWYTENFTSSRQGMSQAIETLKFNFEKNPMSKMFADKNQAHDFMLSAWKNIWMNALRSLKGVFSQQELCFLLEIHNGHIVTPVTIGFNILPVAISDSIQFDGSVKQWDVDHENFIQKAKSLTSTEAICLEIWAEGFWYGDQEEKDFMAYVEQLT